LTHEEAARHISGPCEWSDPCESTGPIGYFTRSPEGFSRECRNCCDAKDITEALEAAWTEGYDAGYSSGQQYGHEAGARDGFAEGYDKGRTDQ
jgi:flagellar biosynthesis/type III secretory pathway protein FliH